MKQMKNSIKTNLQSNQTIFTYQVKVATTTAPNRVAESTSQQKAILKNYSTTMEDISGKTIETLTQLSINFGTALDESRNMILKR